MESREDGWQSTWTAENVDGEGAGWLSRPETRGERERPLRSPPEDFACFTYLRCAAPSTANIHMTRVWM